MKEEMIQTDVGNFLIEISSQKKGFTIKITSPTGYIHRDTCEKDPFDFSIHWISDQGIDKEESYIGDVEPTFNDDYRIYEWGRDNDLPYAESIVEKYSAF